MARTPVILLPGVVLPAALAYPGLVAALGDGFECVPKELEVYAGPEPPIGFGLDTEVEGIERAAQRPGFERFHLVGYSGGGASSLAFAANYPERLLSLALLEPAWAGNEGLGPEEQALRTEGDRIKGLPPDQRMPAFMRAQVAAGTPLTPPPDGTPPPWMASRPAGVKAFLDPFPKFHLDIDALRRFEPPHRAEPERLAVALTRMWART